MAQRIEGTTDSEWIYALVLSLLDDPYGLPEPRELADATAAALRVLREAVTTTRTEHVLLTIAAKFAEVLLEAGFPPQSFSLLTGSGAAVGDVLVQQPEDALHRVHGFARRRPAHQ